jgi:mevalonate kinase
VSKTERGVVVGTAPGKVILLGEHAVVYGRPAIAVPVSEVQARAEVRLGDPGQGVILEARDLEMRYPLSDAGSDDPLAAIVWATLARLEIPPQPDITILVESTIPIARGLGSGAAVSTAVVRALAAYFDKHLTSRGISDLVFESEKLHHGTPSGIDNTVIAFKKPVYFVRGRTLEIFWVRIPFMLAIADTGIPSKTKDVVADVRRGYEENLGRYEFLFDEVAEIVQQGRAAIEMGDLLRLGGLMNRNHAVLQAMGVSCPELDLLAHAALDGGALGAKLSGAGRGGNLVALITPEIRGRMEMFLRLAGAKSVIITEVS